MGLRVVTDGYWPEVTSATNLSKVQSPHSDHRSLPTTSLSCALVETGCQCAQQQGCEVWEFSSASDQDDMEAEQAALQQHILALVSDCVLTVLGTLHSLYATQPAAQVLLPQADPSMQFSSLEALTAPPTDLTALPSAALWNSLCRGLTACLASNSKPTLISASSLIISLAHDHTRIGDHACTAQLFCCMSAAAEQASSVEASAAIWQACLPLVRSLAVQLPQTCMHHSDSLLAKMVEAFCKLHVLCIAGSPLHSSVVFSIGGGDPLDWWHSWLARSRLAKVTSSQCFLIPSCASKGASLPLEERLIKHKPIAFVPTRLLWRLYQKTLSTLSGPVQNNPSCQAALGHLSQPITWHVL